MVRPTLGVLLVLIPARRLRADVNACTAGDKRSALLLAAGEDHAEVVRTLLAQPSCNPNAQDTEGVTPVWAAAEAGALEALRALLAHPGIDINRADNAGRTPLWFSAAMGNLEALGEILSHTAADPNLADSEGLTPLHAAASRNSIGKQPPFTLRAL